MTASAAKDQRSALAICAHPDDVEIYCLGLLLRLRSQGWRIGWVVATEGQAGMAENASADERVHELFAAGEKVGVTPVCLSLLDGQLSDTAKARKAVRSAIKDFQPDLIITHHPDDYHADHRALSHMVRECCGLKPALVYADTMLGVGCVPDFAVDIGTTVKKKHDAFRSHASQKPDLFLPKLKIWEQFRAVQTFAKGVKSAEAYCFPDLYQKQKVQRLLKDVFV